MRIALAQITSVPDQEANLRAVRAAAAEAAEQDAALAVFPEATQVPFGTRLRDFAQPSDGPWARGLVEAAASTGVTIVAGGFTPADGDRVRNTLFAASPSGALVEYHKIHLYDAFGSRESDTVAPGSALASITLDGERIGLNTCYDVRFPEQFIAQATAGARINVVSASWGSGPGKAEQWDLLVRARALDATAFVVAVDQADPATQGIDAHPKAPTGIGLSTVVAPDGRVIERLGSGPQVAVVDIDPTLVDSVRATLPVLAGR